MTKKEMLSAIRGKMGVIRLPLKKDIPDTALLRVAIDKYKWLHNYARVEMWEGMIPGQQYKYIEYRKGHEPGLGNCPLCYKYLYNVENNRNGVCPIAPRGKACEGVCIPEYILLDKVRTMKGFSSLQQKIINKLETTLYKIIDKPLW